MTMALVLSVALGAGAPSIEMHVASRSQQPGELLVVTITSDSTPVEVRVRVFDQLIPAFQTSDGAWQALVGIDVTQRPGTYTLTAEARVGSQSVQAQRQLAVEPKRFPVRRLLVAPEFVNPPPSMADRIEREAALLADAYAHSASTRLWRPPFVRPVAEPANSRFGTRSIFNGKARNPHTGTDFLSPAGTPVRSPNTGRVVIARDLFFSGNTVVIDHGLGVLSLLAHLSRIDVHEGQDIGAGAIVGLVGATGRVTGPHLHWALRVSGARVDPISALELLGEQHSVEP